MSPRLLLGIGVYLLALTYTGITNYFDTDDMMNLYGAWHSLPDQVRPAASLFFGCFQGSIWMIYAILCATFLYSAILIAIKKPGWWPAITVLLPGPLTGHDAIRNSPK